MTKNDLAGVCTKIYQLLEPLDANDRKRAVNAALALLGDASGDVGAQPPGSGLPPSGQDALPMRAASWMRSNAVSKEQLNQVFHIQEGKVEVIAAQSPGASKKVQTVNAYILAGLRAFLETGEAKFSDNDARDTCKSLGCYDQANHAAYLKGKGNSLSGSKNSGWMLTSPGQAAGAILVKAIAGSI